MRLLCLGAIALQALSLLGLSTGFLRSLNSYPPALRRVTTAVNLQGSAGVEQVIAYLNGPSASKLLASLSLLDKKLGDEISSANFWTNSASVTSAKCTGIVAEGLELDVTCMIKGKTVVRRVLAPFPAPVDDESRLKLSLIEMATTCERLADTSAIALLPFGYDCTMPLDFKFNNVPHPPWVRNYIYQRSTQAVLRAVNDDTISSFNKSRLQLKFNVPEVNPAFDTYRLGTLLEMVREMVLALTVGEGRKVKVCVQQALGEGIFVGMPLALSSMRVVLEKMDWGPDLTPEQKWRPGDESETPRPEALIRLGTVGANQVADDDDVIIVMCPQNVVGGMIIEELEAMSRAASARGVALLAINPLLQDRPSSNNMMQVRGRAERRAFQDSFVDIFCLRLLYPSSGGYMFPIGGMISKKGYREPWCVYAREDNPKGEEVYKLLAAFPPSPQPDPNVVSSIFTSGLR